MPGKFKRTGVWCSNPATVRGSQAFLEGDPTGKKLIYCCGKNIYIRDIENPLFAKVNSEHSCTTTSAKFAPSGYYVASGDERGNLRIWDPNNDEAKVKEYIPFSGSIKDIAWTEDSKRIIVVGHGNDSHGAAILADSGSRVGDINLVARTNSCDVRQMRPYRAVTGSDNCEITLFQGPPFKSKNKITKHGNFVQKTKYSPDGAMFASGGSDGQLNLFDWDDGEFKYALGEGKPAHKGSIYGLSWSGDSKQILTASPDKTCKIWDVETGKAVTEFVIGTDVLDQQMACVWQNNYLISLSLNGNINYLDPNDASKPCRVIQGHQKPVLSLAVNNKRDKVYSGSYDGVTNCWDYSTGLAKAVGGKSKPKLITQIDFKDGKLSTVGTDDTLRVADEESGDFLDDTCGLDSQPKCVARGAGDLSVIGGIEKLTLLRGTNKCSVLDVTYTASSVDIHPNQSEVAVGDETGKMHIYSLAGDKLTEKKDFTAHSGKIARCRYSSDGENLAVASTNKETDVYKVQSDYEGTSSRRYKHYSMVLDLAWSPDNTHYATTSLDGSIYVWDLKNEAPISEKRIHGRDATNCIVWLDEKTLVTGGADGCLKTINVEF